MASNQSKEFGLGHKTEEASKLAAGIEASEQALSKKQELPAGTTMATSSALIQGVRDAFNHKVTIWSLLTYFILHLYF